MDQKIISLFDRYTHGGMNRREFLDKLKLLAGSAAGATALLPLLENNYAKADILPEGDARIATSSITFEGGSGYLVQPKSEGKFGSIVVIHENRGLNPHIKDIARRVAAEGFVALAPDYLNGLGGTPTYEDKARDMIGTLKPDGILATSRAALDAAKVQSKSNGKGGVIGFCWGGSAVNALAVADQTLDAGVAYYGMQPPAADVAKIKAPLLLHYAGLDERTNAGIPAFDAALKAAGTIHEIYVYDGVNHAFNNDTNAARYDKTAADLAWGRSIAFLKKYLS
ncbi:MAG: dienelactone hydrolase family protein [Aestuariivirga sp.]